MTIRLSKNKKRVIDYRCIRYMNTLVMMAMPAQLALNILAGTLIEACLQRIVMAESLKAERYCCIVLRLAALAYTIMNVAFGIVVTCILHVSIYPVINACRLRVLCSRYSEGVQEYQRLNARVKFAWSENPNK